MSSDGKAWWRNADDEFGDETWREMVAESKEQMAIAETEAARTVADGSSWWGKSAFLE